MGGNGWGGKRLGAGAPRKSREDHIREGTYVEARHGRTLWDELDAREWSEEEWTARVKRALRDGASVDVSHGATGGDPSP